MRTDLLVLVLPALLLQSAAGQVHSSSHASDIRQRRHHEYVELSKKIFAGPHEPDAAHRAANALPTSQIEEITERLHGLIDAEIDDATTGPNASTLETEKAIRSLLGETSLSEWDAQTSNTPYAALTSADGEQVLAVAYGILRGGGAVANSRSFLEFYAVGNGKPRLAGAADLDFDGCTFFVSPMDAALYGQVWFLAWGKVLGDSGSRLKLRLYAFDGTSVRTIWRRDGLRRGLVNVSRNSVSLEYDREPGSLEPRVQETLHIATKGLR